MKDKSANFMARKIYEQVRDMIGEETLLKQPGDFCESEMQYAIKFGVSRATVRKAVDDLIKSGRVKRVPGKGLMVAEESMKSANIKFLISLPFVVGDGYFFNVTMGCLQKANDLGYDYKVLNCSSPYQRLQKFMTETLSDYSAIILAVYETQEDATILSLVKNSGRPYVLIDNYPEGTHEPVVINDDFTGGYMMAEYLLNNGHSNILYISSTRTVHTVSERERGFCQALLDYGIIPKSNDIIRIDDPGTPKWELKSLSGIVNTLTSNPYTAVVGYSSIPILSLCSHLIQKGYSIPDTYSLIGFGDLTYMDSHDLSLTSIQVDSISMGTTAVEILDDNISGRTSKVGSMVLGVHLKKGKTVSRIGPGLKKKK